MLSEPGEQDLTSHVDFEAVARVARDAGAKVTAIAIQGDWLRRLGIERRAAALSLDRDLLRELLGQEELRDLIDAGALATVEDDLQHLSERTQATNRDTLHDRC